MRLLEVIPTPDADPAAITAVEQFVDKRLGKAVVTAKDTPISLAIGFRNVRHDERGPCHAVDGYVH